jgi:hypothetical protein
MSKIGTEIETITVTPEPLTIPEPEPVEEPVEPVREPEKVPA